jgi:hypothetical protein
VVARLDRNALHPVLVARVDGQHFVQRNVNQANLRADF